ncbi:unnamed protein product [Meloidogyne enterolobii]|uniref:Uncharacterized protein n=1 Tax=Meloidogyne enterolobii TaxID=390850 RepID=A0ACB0ZW25_MELEN
MYYFSFRNLCRLSGIFFTCLDFRSLFSHLPYFFIFFIQPSLAVKWKTLALARIRFSSNFCDS